MLSDFLCVFQGVEIIPINDNLSFLLLCSKHLAVPLSWMLLVLCQKDNQNYHEHTGYIHFSATLISWDKFLAGIPRPKGMNTWRTYAADGPGCCFYRSFVLCWIM